MSSVSLEGITVRFGATVALDNVALSLTSGRLHALVGENGAGKSTLLKVLFGLVAPAAGTIVVDGEAQRLRSPADAIARGIGMVQQHFDLIASFTVAENVVLGREPRRGARLDRRAARERVAALSRNHDLGIDPDARIDSLSVAAQQRVEILKALYRDAQILLLDEPTAALAPAEAQALWATLKRMACGGKTVAVVTHKLDDVFAHADDVTVLRQGRCVLAGAVSQTTPRELAAAMMPTPLQRSVLAASAAPDRTRPAITIENLSVQGDRGQTALEAATLHLYPGEIVGLAGVDGSGQREFIEAVLGLRRAASGTLRLGATDLAPLTIAQRRAAGIGYIPDDRLARALVLPFCVSENAVLGRQRESAFSTRDGRLRPGAIQEFAAAQRELFAIHGAGGDPPVRTLSGGNQQKLVLARELSRRPAVLLAHQPTRGLDFAAAAFVHEALRRARQLGAAILLASLDLDEILALSDRVAVFFAGHLVATLDRSEVSVERVGQWMTGGTS